MMMNLIYTSINPSEGKRPFTDLFSNPPSAAYEAFCKWLGDITGKLCAGVYDLVALGETEFHAWVSPGSYLTHCWGTGRSWQGKFKDNGGARKKCTSPHKAFLVDNARQSPQRPIPDELRLALYAWATNNPQQFKETNHPSIASPPSSSSVGSPFSTSSPYSVSDRNEVVKAARDAGKQVRGRHKHGW